jgi:hypothetical protein
MNVSIILLEAAATDVITPLSHNSKTSLASFPRGSDSVDAVELSVVGHSHLVAADRGGIVPFEPFQLLCGPAHCPAACVRLLCEAAKRRKVLLSGAIGLRPAETTG